MRCATSSKLSISLELALSRVGIRTAYSHSPSKPVRRLKFYRRRRNRSFSPLATSHRWIVGSGVGRPELISCVQNSLDFHLKLLHKFIQEFFIKGTPLDVRYYNYYSSPSEVTTGIPPEVRTGIPLMFFSGIHPPLPTGIFPGSFLQEFLRKFLQFVQEFVHKFLPEVQP